MVPPRLYKTENGMDFYELPSGETFARRHGDPIGTPWPDVSYETKLNDMRSLTTWNKPGTSEGDAWDPNSIRVAKKIVGNSPDITPEHIKAFEQYMIDAGNMAYMGEHPGKKAFDPTYIANENPREIRLERLDALIQEDIATYKPQPPPKKKSFLRQSADPLFSYASGLYESGANFLDTLGWLGRGLSGGMAGEQLTDMPVPWMREKTAQMEAAGFPAGSIPHAIYKGLGNATVDILALKGMGAAGIPGSLSLPLYGAAQGGREGGWYGAFTGGAQGALTGGILGGVSKLPTGWRVPAGFGAGFATTPGSLEEKISGGAVLGGLSLGGERLKTKDFLENYRRTPAKPGPMEGPTREEIALIDKLDQGLLSEDEVAVRSMVKSPKVKAFLGKRLPELIQTLRNEFIDRNKPINDFVNKVQELTGQEIPFDNNPARLADLYPGRLGAIEQGYRSLQKILRPAAKLQDELNQYGLGKRAIERAERPETDITTEENIEEMALGMGQSAAWEGIKNPPALNIVRKPDGSVEYQEKPLTREQALRAEQAQAERLGPQKERLLKETMEKVNKWDDEEFLKPLRDSGILSQEGYDSLKLNNQHWLPFESLKYIDLERIDQLPAGSELFNVRDQDVIKPMTGASEKIRPVWQSVMDRYVKGISLAERNKVLLKLVEMRDIDPRVEKFIIPLEKGGSLPPHSDYEEIGLFKDGRLAKYAVPKDVGVALKRLSPQTADFFARTFKASAGIFRAGTTGWYLPFSIGNAPRDFKLAMLSNKYGFNPADWVLGFWHGMRSSFGFPSELYNRYQRSYGSFAGLIQRGNPKIAAGRLFEPKAKEVAREAAMFIKNIAQAIELAPRIGIFSRAEKKVSSLEAGFESRRSTIDFSRAGHLMKVLNQYIPFVNARLQARVILLERFTDKSMVKTGIVGKTGMTHREWAIAKALLTSVIPSVTAYLYNTLHHPDLYNEIPDYVKDNYDLVILGEDVDENGVRRPKYAKLAKGDVEQVITNPIINFLEYARQRTPKTFQNMAVTWLSDVSPLNFAREGKLSATAMLASAVPPAIRGSVEAAADINFFTGKPIIPRELRDVAATEQYTERTPGIWKFAGQKSGISPLKIQHFWRSLGGSVFYNPTPGGLAEAMGSRVIGKIGGESLNKAYRLSDQAMRGYNTARMKAEKLIKSGNEMQAQRITDEWNKTVLTILMDMRKYTKQSFSELLDSPFYKQYSFQPGDWKRLLESAQEENLTGLEKRLRYKFHR